MISTLTKKYSFDTVFDSQKVFRFVLEAMSNPARAVNIGDYADKLSGGYSGFLALAVTLLDNEVSFHACGNSDLSEDIAALTNAPRESAESADFVFVTEQSQPENGARNVTESVIQNVIPKVKCGTLADPHKSAAVIIRNSGAPDCRLTFTGPGIDGCAEIFATHTVKNAVALRDAQSYEYPQGIDLLFLSDDGDLTAVPRLTRMEVR